MTASLFLLPYAVTEIGNPPVIKGAPSHHLGAGR